MPRFAKLASHAVTAGCVLTAIAVSHATAQEHDIALPEQARGGMPLSFELPNGFSGTGEARPLYVTSDGSATHTTTPGTPVFGVDHDGVADLIISRPEGNARCTGSLLNDGQSLLTAAHCLTDNDGNPVASNINATWELATNNVSESSADVTIHPMYNGDLTDGYDIAIVQFDTPIVFAVPRYDIYRKTDGGEIGVETVKVGYGRSGFGNTGDTTSSGTKRFGKNKYEDDGLGSGDGDIGINSVGGITNSQTQLTYDFDSNFRNLNLSGNDSDHDAFQFFFPRSEDLGFGDDEVGAAPGDSGGPSFVFDDGEWLIAGVTSYGLRLVFTESGTSSDVDGDINSSWGEFGVDARVAEAGIQSFIDASLIPEPHTVALVISGGLILLHRRRVSA